MYKRVNELLGTDYKNDSEISWFTISSNEFKLTDDFIREFQGLLNWRTVSICQNLSEEIIEEFSHYVDWNDISSCQTLSEGFIRKHQNKLNWRDLSRCQLLSQEFIEEFEDSVDWFEISESQPFINPLHPKLKKKYYDNNILGKLYQETKERGWFVGYIYVHGGNYYVESEIIKDGDFEEMVKARIYWKDFIKTFVVKDYELIRKVKYV